ncbi:hypothetical protein [Ligilactobacillus ceti]|uniref:Uncharacterized protein n=1 Tax=Ligilactobacillus ceti DSM 22408 TaxID=1122146 RepID=A0A0R2KRM4_9LACO|nr:hypothetical protein [Ligilactobacillus ceti]KRN88951.1 hypothetical protein IV53_GL000921 [Ligilactobacillus ceti DSM 22408]
MKISPEELKTDVIDDQQIVSEETSVTSNDSLDNQQVINASPTQEETEDIQPLQRKAYRKQNLVEQERIKTKKLAKRLNWTIFGLIVAIILVYLFMRFINF